MRNSLVLLMTLAFVFPLAACSDSGAAADSGCPAAEPPMLADTPPVTLAECEPPSPISQVIETQVAARAEEADARRAELLDSQTITVVTCGTGTPNPSDRAQSCTAVFAGGRYFLFDAGDGAARSIEALGLPIVDIAALFVTHFHSDHVADVGEVVSRSWIMGRTGSLPVYGGPGIDRLVNGFNSIYALDDAYRHAHHGDAVFPESSSAATAVRIDSPGAGGVKVYDEGGVMIEAFSVDHSPITPSYGYRVSYGGRSVGISGDTIDTPGFRALARQADVLVADVLQRDLTVATECAFQRLGNERNAKIFADVQTYHIGPEELGALAAETGVGTLVLTHQVPVIENQAQAEAAFVAPIQAVYAGEVVLAVDGTEVTVPVGG